jgi:hypothetical protein
MRSEKRKFWKMMKKVLKPRKRKKVDENERRMKESELLRLKKSSQQKMR